MKTLNKELSLIIKHWRYIAIICYPENEKQYEKLLKQQDALLDMIGDDENHVLMGLVDMISHIIQEYESIHYKDEQDRATGIDALKFLMQSHGLSQSDLTEIGSQGVISEILKGKRQLNLRQIKLLSTLFAVAPSTFIDKEHQKEAVLHKSKKKASMDELSPYRGAPNV